MFLDWEGLLRGAIEPLGSAATLKPDVTGFGGRDGCPTREDGPSSCRSFASIFAILSSVLSGFNIRYRKTRSKGKYIRRTSRRRCTLQQTECRRLANIADSSSVSACGDRCLVKRGLMRIRDDQLSTAQQLVVCHG